MIAADRAELESRLKQLTLQIREKEVIVRGWGRSSASKGCP